MNVKLKKYYPIFITFCILSVVFLLKQIPDFDDIITGLDNKFQSITYYDKIPASKNIVVIEIDDKTLSKLGRFPFARREYIPVLENLHNAGAIVVGMDIIFAEKSNEEDDILLAEAFSQVNNVIVGQSSLNNGTIQPIFEPFKDKVLSSGLVATEESNIVFGIPVFKEIKNKIYKYFSIEILETYYNYGKKKELSVRLDDNTYYLGERVKIPLVEKKGKNIMLINYIKPSRFQRYSYLDMYDKNSFEAISKGYDFKDKIVIIGATARGIKDVFYSPLGLDYGVYIHANAINTVLQGEFLIYFNKYIEIALLFFLVLFFVYFNFTRSGKMLLLTNFTVFTILFLLFFLVRDLLHNSIINYPGLILFSLFLSVLFTNLARYLTENKDKNKLSESLSQYVSKDIAKEILSGAGLVNLDGEEKDVAIFFSDIEGFTTISENYSPKELVEFLREYLSLMTNMIIYQKGFIDKYEGDAIMALWGAFGHNESMHDNACKTAILQMKMLKIMNYKWAERGIPPINIRIGLNSGKAILGNIGSVGKKLEFTALGDNVNLASRLEGINKFYGTNICVSQEIVDNVIGKYVFRYLDTIKVKGKDKPVKIFELIGFEEDKMPLSEAEFTLFEKAIKLYEVGEFKRAKTIFSKLSKIGDNPSKTYTERCGFFIKNPPENWDGVWQMSEK